MTPLLKISESLVESVPKSSPPWIWVGFLLVFVFFLLETLMVLLELDERRMTAFLTLIAISGSIYWFVCVHRLHKILVEITKGRYPITGAQSVGMHFIPFYNFYWIFKWPAVMTDYLNGQRRVQIISGYLLGVFILIGALLRWEVDSGAGLFILFSVTLYLSLKLKEHVKLIRAALPENLPPLPDPKIFGPRSPIAENPVQQLSIKTE